MRLAAGLAVVCALLTAACLVLWQSERAADTRADTAEATVAQFERANEKAAAREAERIAQLQGLRDQLNALGRIRDETCYRLDDRLGDRLDGVLDAQRPADRT